MSLAGEALRKLRGEKIVESDSKEAIKIKAIGKKAKMLSDMAVKNSNTDLDDLETKIKKMAKQAVKLNTNYFSNDELKTVKEIADGKFSGSGYGQVSMESASKLASLIGESLDESKTTDVIKELINTDWSKDNEAQMKAVQLLKGIALSDEPEANAFMAKIDKFTSGMKE